MKKLISFIMCGVLLFCTLISAAAETETTREIPITAAPWMLIESINITFYVSANGNASITYAVTSNSEYVDVTVYVEKKTSLFGWSQVGKEHTVHSEKRYITGEYVVPVSGEGEYRAVIIAVPEYKGAAVERVVTFDYSKKSFLGDVNADGYVTAIDARLALRFASRLQTYTEAQKKQCDMDKNGKITSADARRILRISAKFE